MRFCSAGALNRLRARTSRGEWARRLPEGVVVLFRQHRGGHQDRHLLAVHGGLERGPHRHLGFAVAHVAANQAVHGLIRHHIRQHVGDGLQLVRGFLIFEGGFELPVSRVRRREVVTRQHPAQGIQLHQFPGDLFHRLFYPALGPLPGFSPQAGHPRAGAFHPQVFLHQIQAVHGEVKAVPALIFQLQKVVDFAAHRELDQPPVDADAVVQMDHAITFRQVGQGGEILEGAGFLAAPSFRPEAQGFIFGEDHQPFREQPKPPGQFAHGDFHPAPGFPGGRRGELHLQALLGEQPGQAFGPVLAQGHQEDLKPGAAPFPQALRQGRYQPAGLVPGLGQFLGQVIVFLHLEGDIPVLVRVPPGQEGAENLG